MRLAARGFTMDPSDFVMRTGPVQMARSQLAGGDFINTQNSCTTDICPGRWKCEVDDAGRCRVCGKVAEAWTYDYLLQHDDDLDVMPVCGPYGSPIDLWKGLMESDKRIGVIGAVYLREAPLVPTIAVKDDQPGRAWNAMTPIGGWPAEPFEVDGIGTGFFMVRRELIEAIIAENDGDIFQFKTDRNPFGVVEVLGEDYEFCFKAKKLGYKVVADPRIPTRHLKPSGVLVYEHTDWARKMTDERSPMQLDLGPNSQGAKLVKKKRQTIYGNDFEMLCIDMYDVKARQGEELAARKRKVSNAI